MASATPHLLRFGGRLAALSFASFAVAGILGLVAVAELFEQFFLASRVLDPWDKLALRAGAAFAVAGAVRFGLAQRKNR